MGILLGLTAALAWGFADVLATVASRRTGPFGSCSAFHVVAMVLLAVLLAATGEGLAGVSAGDLAWLVLVGLLGGLSYLALAIGPISIVSPIVSAVALLGERPRTTHWRGSPSSSRASSCSG